MSVQLQLVRACEAGRTSEASRLLSQGADVDVGAVCSLETSMFGVVEWTPLQAACFKGQQDVVTLLINAHAADVNKATTYDGATPLCIACQNGHAPVVSLLLAAHADVNKARTDTGATPLYTACYFGYAPVVSLLLAAHADVNKATTDDGITPLYMACQKG